MQCLKIGFLVELVKGVEFWLDGGYNVVGGVVIVKMLVVQLLCLIYLICGMFNIKDVIGYMFLFVKVVDSLMGVFIFGEVNMLLVDEIVVVVKFVGFVEVMIVNSIKDVFVVILMWDFNVWVLICGLFYLVGVILWDYV